MERYDGIIIGFGKGGKTLAADLAGQGKKIAMIEKSEKMYGGTCINVGCIPSKSLVKNAVLAKVRGVQSFEEKKEFYRQAVDEKRQLTAMLRKKNFDKLAMQENITIFNGTASFLDAHRVSVRMKEETVVLEGDLIFINTGSVPVLSGIEGAENKGRVHTSETLMEEQELPKRLAILGGGYIGLEFASIYRNFGSEVSVFESGDRLLQREDEDLVSEICKVLQEKGVQLHLSSEARKLEHLPEETVLTYLDRSTGELNSQSFDAVLFATGRKPNTEDLQASFAGVELTERGAVKVDERRRTTAENIYAMGDVVGDQQFTYISLDDFRIVRADLKGEDHPYTVRDRNHVPYSVFMDPPFSRVGLNEKEAKDQGYQIRIGKLPAAAIPKAQVLKETQGLLKVVIEEKTDRILGAMLFCAESHEMINVIKLAMDSGLPYQRLRDQIYTHPTMTESFNDLFTL